MKIKDQVLSMAAILLFASFAAGQEFKVTMQNAKEGKLMLKEFSGDLPVEGYSGNEIIITVDGFKKPEEDARAKGLKAIYPGGEDNTGLGLFMEKNGNQVSFHCLLPIGRRYNYKVRIPDNIKLEIENECAKSGEVEIRNLKNEIEIKNCHSVSLKNVSGPVVVSTISGDIDVVFTDLNKERPLSLASVSGRIDISLPAKAPVTVEMNTISGSIYTDFDFPTEENKMKKIGGGGAVKAPLNGGGVNLKITNVSGNIYLRKG